MGWKPKEKQLTPDEALALARADEAPYWLGGHPVLAGVRGADGRVSVHPLEDDFRKKAWFLLFADLTGFRGDALLHYVREWARRFSAHGLGFMLIVRPSYSFLADAAALPPLLRRTGESFPVALDHEGLLTEAFGARSEVPFAQLFHKNKVVFESSGPGWEEGAEVRLQAFLRLTDPGLPLAPPFRPVGPTAAEVGTLGFGKSARTPGSQGWKITGKFEQEADRVVVSSPETAVRFANASDGFTLVAHSMPAREATRMRVELGTESVFEAAAAADLVFNDEGGAEVRIGEGRPYHVLHGLKGKPYEIVLRFPDAAKAPVALYVIRLR